MPDGWAVARSRGYRPGYESDRGSVVERLRAWSYSDAERLLYVDSDCVFCRPVDFQTEPTINLEKPVVMWRTWEEAVSGAVWHASARETLGFDPPLETMCRYPFCFPWQVLRDFWAFVGGEARLLSLPTFTDWNALGPYALQFHPDKVTKLHAGIGFGQPACVRQFWSHHRANHPQVLAELERLGLA